MPEDGTRRGRPDRYARQVLLPEVGPAGQRRLAEARVLVVGAGGLGSPALLYLAAAGVGTLGVVDDDLVDETNLHRQVLHGAADLGRPKTDSAADALARLDPDLTVRRHPERLTAANAVPVLSGYDLVVDGSDTFATRYLVGDACAVLGVPHVWASVLRFDAQVAVWWAGHGPCYRCVFPHPPAPDAVPSCAQAGVLGALCGAVGSVQATEALKLLLGVGEPLLGRVLIHDALRQTWDAVAVRADPRCATCARPAGSLPPTLAAPEEPVCRVAGPGGRGDLPGQAATVTAYQLAAELAGAAPPVLVDVRGPAERAALAIAGHRVAELADLESGAALAESVLGPRSGRVVLYCRSGARSSRGVALLQAAGWAGAVGLEGGVLAWVRELEQPRPAP